MFLCYTVAFFFKVFHFIIYSSLQINLEFFLCRAILKPIVTHIPIFLSFRVNVVVKNPVAVELSVLIGVGFCGCPNAFNVFLIGIAIR